MHVKAVKVENKETEYQEQPIWTQDHKFFKLLRIECFLYHLRLTLGKDHDTCEFMVLICDLPQSNLTLDAQTLKSIFRQPPTVTEIGANTIQVEFSYRVVDNMNSISFYLESDPPTMQRMYAKMSKFKTKTNEKITKLEDKLNQIHDRDKTIVIIMTSIAMIFACVYFAKWAMLMVLLFVMAIVALVQFDNWNERIKKQRKNKNTIY